jgi:hypothetical protein
MDWVKAWDEETGGCGCETNSDFALLAETLATLEREALVLREPG